jgi:L-fuconolactonase
MIIDAHQHVWDPRARRHAWLDELPALNQPFGLADFDQASAPEGVTASVLVQVLASAAETEEFLALAAGTGGADGANGATGADGSTGRAGGADGVDGVAEVGGGTGPTGGAREGLTIAGVVGWADLTSPGVADEIARLRAGPGGGRLVGIRHLVESEPDPDWLRRPDVRRGLQAVGAAGLPYDLLVRPAQLPAALAVTGELDDVRFVLDHGAKPPIASGRYEPWASMISDLAARPNVVCKLSGLVTEAGPGWRPAQIAPYIDHLLDRFGPGRLMFGSDWPVCTLAASYAHVVALARGALAGRLGPGEMDAFFVANATSAYGLELEQADRYGASGG